MKMDRDDSRDIHALIPHLSELELACLICLVADKHCIVRAADEDIGRIQKDLQSISASTFGFSCAIVNCSPRTRLQDISKSALEGTTNGSESPSRDASLVPFHSTRARSPLPTNTLDERKTCNVVILRNLDQTDRDVQVQALELMRSRRIYSHTAAHLTPKHFLLIALISESVSGPPFMTPHLNDQFFILHQHTSSPSASSTPHPSLRFRSSNTSLNSTNSLSSVIHTRPQTKPSPFTHSFTHANPPIRDSHLTYLTHLVATVRPSAEINRHLHNIPSFLRLHRHVAGGVSAISTRHLNLLAKVLAVLQLPAPPDRDLTGQADLEAWYDQSPMPPVITPSLATLAAYKVYAHRIELVAAPEGERSMQWGSDWEVVARELRSASVMEVLDETVGSLVVPA